MPGFKNVGGPRFIGAGMGGYRGDVLGGMSERITRAMTKGMVGENAVNYYAGAMDHVKRNIDVGVQGKSKPKNQKKPKPNIQSWQDRNFKNRKTKLNP
tara:strand:+ start:222 stop:515 length:294 start_codon:yes stop_codon:yes gene_type:complete